MNSLYDISWKVTEEEYRADAAYSYSTIAKFNREGFEKLPRLFDKIDSPSLRFGSIVDSILTGGDKEFESKFLIADYPQLSDTLISITEYLFKKAGISYTSINEMPDRLINEACTYYGYYNGSKYESYRLKQVKEKCSVYYNLLCLSLGKTVIKADEYQDAVDCCSELQRSHITSFYFESNPFDTDIERYYQLKFKGIYEDILLRCMADVIIVNHKDRTIIPCDLKTTSKPEWAFHISFVEWNYWIQAQLYWYIIRQNLDKDEVYKDYKLLDYRFIVIGRYTKTPLVWEYPDTEAVTSCIYGKSKQYECRNWREIVRELDYYMKSRPKYPLGIEDINNIVKWLNK